MENFNRVGGGLRSQTLFDQIISSKNLFAAWHFFKIGKTKKADVIAFSKNYALEISLLRSQLSHKQYVHWPYTTFYIQDPKLREINKAYVRDRVVHHAIFRKLYYLFDATFIFDSYSCRIGKGTHRAVRRLQEFFKKVSNNNTQTCWVLKCDVKKFFDSINQDILLNLIKKKIKDEEVIWLIEVILKSFKRGLPLGNITSQLFANIYLNELDQFVKHILRAKYYIRYCDDFLILSDDKDYLENSIATINNFLKNHLKLSLHPDKITIKKFNQGIDFLGYVSYPSHIVMRLKTKKRMIKNIKKKLLYLQYGITSKKSFHQTLQSYLGILSHCNGYHIKEEILVILKEANYGH